MFGHSAPDEPVEIVSYRVRGIGKVPPVEMPRFARTGKSLADARREMDTNYFGTLSVTRAFTPVIERNGGGAMLNASARLSLHRPKPRVWKKF